MSHLAEQFSAESKKIIANTFLQNVVASNYQQLVMDLASAAVHRLLAQILSKPPFYDLSVGFQFL